MIFTTTVPNEPRCTLNCCSFSKGKYWYFTSMSTTILETHDLTFSLLTFWVIYYCTELSNSSQGLLLVPFVMNAPTQSLSFSMLPGSHLFLSVFLVGGWCCILSDNSQMCARILESDAKLLCKHWKSIKICPPLSPTLGKMWKYNAQ